MKWKVRKKCCYCRQTFAPEFINREHVIPASKGGNNSQWNVHPCCRFCNDDRRAMKHEVWAKVIQEEITYLYPTSPRRMRWEAVLKRIPFWIAYIKRNRSKMIDHKHYVIRMAAEIKKFNPEAPLL